MNQMGISQFDALSRFTNQHVTYLKFQIQSVLMSIHFL